MTVLTFYKCAWKRRHALGRRYWPFVARAVCLWGFRLSAFFVAFVLLSWISGYRNWFDRRGREAIALAFCFGAILRALCELFPREVRLHDLTLVIEHLNMSRQALPLARIATIKSIALNVHIARVEIRSDDSSPSCYCWPRSRGCPLDHA